MLESYSEICRSRGKQVKRGTKLGPVNRQEVSLIAGGLHFFWLAREEGGDQELVKKIIVTIQK